ncbi:hypothetical protein D3C75_1091430 [compost metagenome]
MTLRRGIGIGLQCCDAVAIQSTNLLGKTADRPCYPVEGKAPSQQPEQRHQPHRPQRGINGRIDLGAIGQRIIIFPQQHHVQIAFNLAIYPQRRGAEDFLVIKIARIVAIEGHFGPVQQCLYR